MKGRVLTLYTKSEHETSNVSLNQYTVMSCGSDLGTQLPVPIYALH